MNENDTVNSSTGENDEELVVGMIPTGNEDTSGQPPETEGGEDTAGGDTDGGDTPDAGEDPFVDSGEPGILPEEGAQGSMTGETELSETTELPTPDPGEKNAPDMMTCVLLGVSVALALAVVVLSVLLIRGKKRTKKNAGEVEPIGEIEIGKLHQQGDRESQQDCFAVSPSELTGSHGLLAVVADGMGGLADGDKVSQTAVAAMLDGFLSAGGAPEDMLLELTECANRQINRLLGPAGIGKSGSTLVAGLVRGGRFHYLSVGDSRICLYRGGQLIQLNREHIYRNELSVQALNGIGSLRGAASHPKAGGLTSYLGMGNLKYVDIPAQPIEICSGDKFILMSDGVYNALSEAEISAALNETAQQAADRLGAMIAEKAYRNQDNYTAVILSC